MQRTAGNGAVQRLLRAVAPAPGPLVQRASRPSPPTDEEAVEEHPHNIVMGGTVVNGYEDALDLIARASLPLAECTEYFKRFNISLLPPEVKRVLDQGHELIRAFKGRSGIMSYDDLDRLTGWYEASEKAEFAGRAAQGEILQGDLLRKRDEVRRAQAELARMEPTLRNLQRRYFQSDEPSTLVVVGDVISGFIETQEELKDLSLKVETAFDQVRSWRTTRTLPMEMAELTGPGAKLVEAVGKIKSTYDTIKKLSDTISLLLPQRTAKQDAMAGVTLMGMISDVGVPFGEADILKTNLPLTGYPIGPMIEQASKMMTRINQLSSDDHNRQALDWRRYDLVVWSNEPGGRRMFNFMARVMRAGSPEEVPDVDDHVANCFLTHADRFEGALGGRTKVPTQGTFWTTLKPDAMKQWIFTRRKGIWGALYGAAAVPN